MKEEYKAETYIQTLSDGRKRIVIELFKVTKELIKTHFIDIKIEKTNCDDCEHLYTAPTFDGRHGCSKHHIIVPYNCPDFEPKNNK